MQTTSDNPKPAGDPQWRPRDDANHTPAHGSGPAEDVTATAGAIADNVKAKGADMLEAARDRANDLADEGKEAGSRQMRGFATAIRNAAEDLEDTSPEIAGHVRAAAGSIEEISSALRDRSVGQLISDANLLARRHPAAFFGVAAVAGFALARFAKSSGEASATASSREPPAQPLTSRAPGWVPAADDKVARPATMAAATLGGAAAHRSVDALPGSMPTKPAGHGDIPRDVSAGPGGAASHADPVPNERSGSQL